MSSIQIGIILGDLSFGTHGYERDHWGYESLYKIFKLIHDNVEKLRDDHIANSSLSMISQRSGIYAPLTNKLHDLEWERYKTLRDTLHLRRVASKVVPNTYISSPYFCVLNLDNVPFSLLPFPNCC